MRRFRPARLRSLAALRTPAAAALAAALTLADGVSAETSAVRPSEQPTAGAVAEAGARDSVDSRVVANPDVSAETSVTPTLVTAGRAPTVEVAPGRAVTLPLAADETVVAVAGTAERWFAAGVRALPPAEGTTAKRQELALFTGDTSGVRHLPVPGGRTGALRADPVLVTAGGALAGLAWLEGDEHGALGVRFARWQTGEKGGGRWARTERVAAPGPGTQIALAGTALADGSLLLVWAGFDGEDDEILWSRRGAGGAWSRPQTVGGGNAVPDVTPAVTALPGGGALAAWSHFDEASAQYLVRLARFDGTAWSAPRAVAPPGTMLPSFEEPPGLAAAAPRLLVRTAAPRGWAVLELDGDGRARRVAHAEAAAPERPRIADAAGGVDLTWPGSGRPARTLAWEVLP